MQKVNREKIKSETIRIAVLYICTGKYVAFWEDFYNSCEKYFCYSSEKEYFVFTDSAEIYGEKASKNKIHRIYQKNLGWPGNTLFRYKMFCSIKEKLNKFDYIFFFNANIKFLHIITEEEFLPTEELLVVMHPGYYCKSKWKFPYERRKKSFAYIPYGRGQHYVCGGVNGGKGNSYLKMAEELENRILEEYNHGIIAKWHDESHLNAYIYEHNSYNILTPAYAYPEDWKLPFEQKILIKDKLKTIEFDMDRLQDSEQRTYIHRICSWLKNIIIDIFSRREKDEK